MVVTVVSEHHRCVDSAWILNTVRNRYILERKPYILVTDGAWE